MTDGEDPDPNNADSDGDGIPDGQDTDADGNGVPDADESNCDPSDPNCTDDAEQGTYGEGKCTKDEQTDPDCKSNMDAVQCGIFIEQFRQRCQSKLQHEDIVGTDEYRDGPSVSDTDNDGNKIPGKEVSASGLIGNLKEDEVQFSNASCPADRTFSMPGAIGGSFTISYELICDGATMIRPAIIALGYFLSAMILMRKFSGSGGDD
ncbi:hypothetical protein A11A3_09390 [Alcanivorax hongdengensis A-11-3]|uniref:Thrombospondin type 3 repeat-containing protein n=1 Tax=Alcanivorax hongdengensis A-11-3 TaxID=1177179 RepID=L0WDH7_9GAMM|nr:hypothetical protein A11A3_09390 [Alcanivorax hongdengensis A-11-3]